MKTYELSYRTYNQTHIDGMQQLGFDLYIGRWTPKLCATVRADDAQREQLTRTLAARGLFPEWAEVIECQPAQTEPRNGE